MQKLIALIALTACCHAAEPVRVFIFAGQSNMVGSDSKVQDIKRFPPFRGLEAPQKGVRFSYCIGRNEKTQSEGWTDLLPVNNIVGPELSFAREVTRRIDAPIAIIKVAAGGTHLGGDWNPEEPEGFKMYPLALKTIRESLKQLDDEGVDYRLEGFMWHQGENDMFNEEYKQSYGKNLAAFLARWRRDLNAPQLRFYIGELCTKTIWGMDLRPRMYAISLGQKEVCHNDPLAQYIPTSHVGVEIGGGVGLHYHYGTLGQLEHGHNYANAYLRNVGIDTAPKSNTLEWPYKKGSKIKLLVLAGHRNMEGERAFVQELRDVHPKLLNAQPIPYHYSIGGGYQSSSGWEPLRPAGYYDTFGPEVSLGEALRRSDFGNFAIAKFTHSGTQMNDWTREGSMAKTRHIYPAFIQYVKDRIQDLEERGHEVELTGICYHVGENEMSMPHYRRDAAMWMKDLIDSSRKDLGQPSLRWFVTQQPPTDHERVNKFDVVSAVRKVAAADPNTHHLLFTDFPEQPKQLVLNTEAILALGRAQAHFITAAPPAETVMTSSLTDQQIADFAGLAFKGLFQEFPNKPSNVMASAEDVRSPQQMHPVFYGNFDWHSSVHGHWMLVRLLKLSPDAPVAARIRDVLNQQLTAEKLKQETEYFQQKHNRSFERMYGWAWLLQLVREVHSFDDADAGTWRANLKPLEEVIVSNAKTYLPKLSFPIRVGTHTDTGFALGMALDYARTIGDQDFESLIIKKAKEFYLNDKDYPAHYEPSGHDFFSSGFNEADLMRRVLSREEFSEWLDAFLPDLRSDRLGSMTVPVEVPDTADGHLVHLAGLDLSRAWTINGILHALPDNDPRRMVLQSKLEPHMKAGLSYVLSGHYEGEHWLATFAVYQMTNSGLEVKQARGDESVSFRSP